jgi:hypothetical protein
MDCSGAGVGTIDDGIRAFIAGALVIDADRQESVKRSRPILVTDVAFGERMP